MAWAAMIPCDSSLSVPALARRSLNWKSVFLLWPNGALYLRHSVTGYGLTADLGAKKTNTMPTDHLKSPSS